MSSSVKPGRVIRSAPPREDVFVVGETARETIPAPRALTTASALVAAAEERAAAIVEDAGREAAAIVTEARAAAGAVRHAALQEGRAAGRAEVVAEAEGVLALLRRAAGEGKTVRDEVAGQAALVVAKATMLALRRIAADWFDAHPERTAAVCAEALRAAAGQEILSIRVNPGLVSQVQATLADAATYVRPDETIEVGGCVIDLRNGRLDATLDARLSLMELALSEAAGAGQ